MNELIGQFNYEGYGVRFSTLRGEPALVASDACRVLGLGNATRAVERLDDDEKGLTTIQTPGGDQRMLVITQTGLIKLAMTSRKPEAKPFQRWVAERIKEIMQDGITTDPEYDDHPAMIAASSALNAVRVAIRAEKAAQVALSRIDELTERLGGPTDPYVSIAGWASVNRISLSNKNAGQVGKIAVGICKAKGIEVDSVPSERWGRVNTYPESVVAEAYDRYWNQR